ncbi:MAG: DegT/DnrJ/EryC1/StrS family aminotransferase [Desulfatibacillaceae bacterium]
MQFIDLAAQQARIREKIESNIHAVLDHGKYVMGPEIAELEKRLAEYSGTRHALGCSSGTDALLMALMAHGVGPGDAIFTTPFTFIATAEVIALLGATPVFVDVSVYTYNMDPARLEDAIRAVQDNDPDLHVLPGNVDAADLTPRGVIAVDLFGLPADYDAINEVAHKHGLFVVEDAAQSFGGRYKGGMAGSLAGIGCTSFFPAKPLGCYGDGGMCFTDDDDMYDLMESVRVHGKGTDKYDNARVGINGRLDTLQAAILLAKFDIFPEEVEMRNRVAARYNELLEPTGKLVVPHVPEGYVSAWAQYSVLARDGEHRAALQAALKEQGVPTAVYYPKCLHLQTAFAHLGYKPGDFARSEDFSTRIFSLPMHPYLGGGAQEIIAETIARAQ